MGACKRPDIAERLMMALSPSDFPHEAAELEAHLKECPACREEMKALRRMEKFLGDNKDLMAELLSPCPEADALTSFALGEASDPSVERHLELCIDCREQVALIRELSQEKLDSGKLSASAQERSFFHEAVAKEYGPAKRREARAIQNLWETVSDWLNIPSLALGAAVAALLMVFLMPRGPEELRLTPVLSSAVWEKPSDTTKGPLEPKELLTARKKVAVILLLHGASEPLGQDAEQIYSKLEIVKKLGAAYDFLSPKEIKEALAGREVSGNLINVADAIFDRTSADYLLAFEILPANAGDAVKGTLFQRDRKGDLGSISQTGLSISRIPSRITTMGAELLLEAEPS